MTELQSVEIKMRRAPDDPPERDPAFQEELRTFSAALHDAGVAYTQRAMAFDSADAFGYPLAEFVIKQLGPVAIPAVATAIGVWLQAHYGRKVRVEVGDLKVEARTPEEAERLLESAAAIRASSPGGDKAS